MNEVEENDLILAFFDEMIHKGSQQDLDEYLYSHPLLLSNGIRQVVLDGRGNKPQVINALSYLEEIHNLYWNNVEEYPIGPGPLEKIIFEMRDGNIGYEEALEKACHFDCAVLLSPIYIKALMAFWLEELENDLTFAKEASEITIEAVLSMPLKNLFVSVMMQGAEGFILFSHKYLTRRPDGVLYNKAIAAGIWAVNIAEYTANQPLKGEFLHDIGTLSLDAYSANFGPSPEYPDNIKLWLARADHHMPAPSEGLANACNFLSEAVDLRESGSEKGRTLKALLEAIIYESFVTGTKADPILISSLSEQALSNLDPSTDEFHINRVRELKSLVLENP
jgi:hypothetical protein